MDGSTESFNRSQLRLDDGIVVSQREKGNDDVGLSYRVPKRRRKTGMTTVEYLQTPETVLPRELAFGVLRVADAPTLFHQRVVRDVTVALHAFVREYRLGEV